MFSWLREQLAKRNLGRSLGAICPGDVGAPSEDANATVAPLIFEVEAGLAHEAQVVRYRFTDSRRCNGYRWRISPNHIDDMLD